MIKKILLLAFSLIIAFSACSNGQGGCKICKNKLECNICDNYRFYFLKNSDKSCVKLEGCQKASNTPECTTCNKSMYYFIKSDKSCVKLSKCEQATTGSSPECKKCYSGYQLSTGSKKICYKQIVDCTAYNTFYDCTACKNNKILSKDGSSCDHNNSNCTEKNSSDSNKCKTCAKEYSLSSTQKVCVKSVGNCKIYNDTACTACDPGYTLKEKKCDKEGTTNANIVSSSLAVILVLLALSL